MSTKSTSLCWSWSSGSCKHCKNIDLMYNIHIENKQMVYCTHSHNPRGKWRRKKKASDLTQYAGFNVTYYLHLWLWRSSPWKLKSGHNFSDMDSSGDNVTIMIMHASFKQASTHTHMHTRIHTHTHKHWRMHVCMHTHTYAHMHARTHTHVDTHTTCEIEYLYFLTTLQHPGIWHKHNAI